jgi:hypothetical protein
LILRAALGSLHFPQAGEGADLDWNVEEVALYSVFGELGESRHALRQLQDVETPELGVRGYVAAAANRSGISARTEKPAADGGKGRFQRSSERRSNSLNGSGRRP